MILLRANNELRTVFGRMLKAMKVNVAWTGNFVVLNNFLILSGSVKRKSIIGKTLRPVVSL